MPQHRGKSWLHKLWLVINPTGRKTPWQQTYPLKWKICETKPTNRARLQAFSVSTMQESALWVVPQACRLWVFHPHMFALCFSFGPPIVFFFPARIGKCCHSVSCHRPLTLHKSAKCVRVRALCAGEHLGKRPFVLRFRLELSRECKGDEYSISHPFPIQLYG